MGEKVHWKNSRRPTMTEKDQRQTQPHTHTDNQTHQTHQKQSSEVSAVKNPQIGLVG